MNNPQDIENIINSLTNKQDVYVVESYPNFPGNKIGLDSYGNVVILANTINTKALRFNESHSENLSVFYDLNCNVLIDGIKSSNNYSVLILKDKRLLYYFISLFEIIMEKLSLDLELNTFKEEIDNLRMLFNRLSNPAVTTIMGLWGEMFLIETSSDPLYLINAWHKSSTDIVDFNDGFEKVEVKTTTKSLRIHNFSHSQLKKIINPNTMIASIMTSEIDNGISVNDLIESIKSRVSGLEASVLLSKVLDVLGTNLKYASEIKFDYSTALNSIRYYDSQDIPKINDKYIPKNIKNVHFEVELEESKCIDLNLESKLYKLLIRNGI